MNHQRHLGYIDGLRAIAILSVVCVHATVLLPAMGAYAYGRFTVHHGVEAAVASMLGAGIHGVDLFFVISGFCLSYPVLAKLHEQGRTRFDARSFMSKRIIRIFPPYFFGVVLSAAMYFVLKHLHAPLLPSMDANVGFKDIIKQLFFLDRNTPLLNHVFWTLPIEARWYIVFPAMLAAWIVSRRAFYVVLVLALVAFHVTLASSVDLGTLPVFASGIIAADWFITGRRMARYTLPIGAVAFLLGMLLQSNVRASIFWQIAAFCFVALAGEIPNLRRVLSISILRVIGVASYSIYLAQQQITQLAFRGLQPRVGSLAAWALAVIAGLAAGFLFWYCCERPFTSTRLRGQLLERIHPVVDRCFDAINLHGMMNFRIRGTRIPTITNEIESPSTTPAIPTS